MAADADRLRAAGARLIEYWAVDGWWPAGSRFEIMVGAVLVQHTRWTHVERAIAALRAERCLAPAALADLAPARLGALIRPAGCASVKTRRLGALATATLEAGGVAGLARLETDALRARLLAVHGIGPETAAVICTFAFARPVLVVDAYLRRWLERLGAGPKPGAAALERVFAGLDPAALHAAVVRHGQARCRARPVCAACEVKSFCDFSATKHLNLI